MRAHRSGGMHGVCLLPCGGLVRLVQHKAALAIAQGQLNRIRQTPANALLVHQAVNHQINGVLLVLVQRGHIVQRIELAVDAHTGKAFGLELFELVLMRALLKFHQRGHDHELGALRQGHDIANDFICRAGLDGPPALGAIHAPKPGKKYAQKIVNFRDCPHG